MTQTHNPKLIGELNGKWAMLFKLSLVLLPLFVSVTVGWGVWVTDQLHSLDLRVTKVEGFVNQGPRFTAVDADRLRLDIMNRVSQLEESRYERLLLKMDSMTASITELKLEMTRHIASEDKPKAE